MQPQHPWVRPILWVLFGSIAKSCCQPEIENWILVVRATNAASPATATGGSVARRENAANVPDGQISKIPSSPLCKNISLSPSGKSFLQAPPSRAHQRGASRSSRNVGRGTRWTLWRQARSSDRAGRKRQDVRPSRVVLTPVVGAKFAGSIPPTTVTTKNSLTGEHEVSRQTIARGKPG